MVRCLIEAGPFGALVISTVVCHNSWHRVRPNVLRIFLMFSPSVLKREAIATATTVVRGDFQVSPEGFYSLRGQRCTLNDAIIYAGHLARQQA